MTRLLGWLLCLGGLGILLVVGSDYGRAWMARDAARARWAEIEARQARLAANARVDAPPPGPIAPGTPVARLLVPAIDLDEVIVEGVESAELDASPGHMPGTPLPGGVGNSVVSAHRDLHFRRLGQLEDGDTLTTVTQAGTVTWRITGRQIVRAGSPALFATPTATLTLTTCWPIRFIGPAPDRLLLFAEPVDAPVADEPGGAPPEPAAYAAGRRS